MALRIRPPRPVVVEPPGLDEPRDAPGLLLGIRDDRLVPSMGHAKARGVGVRRQREVAQAAGRDGDPDRAKQHAVERLSLIHI
ncbi:MAG: hypothetical protein ACK559_16950 [bacterium]